MRKIYFLGNFVKMCQKQNANSFVEHINHILNSNFVIEMTLRFKKSVSKKVHYIFLLQGLIPL